MSLRHLMVIATGGDGDAQALGLASNLARQQGGTVAVLPVYPDSAADMIALGMTLGATLSPEAIEELAAAERQIHVRIETAAKAADDAADVVFGAVEGAPRISVMGRGLRPPMMLSRAAPLSDLVIFGQAHLSHSPGRDIFDQCLLGEHAPVLIARHEADSLSGPAAIAWDGSPQAGRAVKAALPLLAMASEIYILQCVTGLELEANDPDTDRLNAYLKLHGVREGSPVLVKGAEEGSALIAAAKGKLSTLLVAGAWGHSRLREAIFGGATRAFLACKDGPNLLLAH